MKGEKVKVLQDNSEWPCRVMQTRNSFQFYTVAVISM